MEAPVRRRRAIGLLLGTHVWYGEQWQRWEVTAYCLLGRTASGAPVGIGVVAGPPSLPFGTRLWIDGYGPATVLDRGPAITEGRLDIWLPTYAQAIAWGRRHVHVWPLGQHPHQEYEQGDADS